MRERLTPFFLQTLLRHGYKVGESVREGNLSIEVGTDHALVIDAQEYFAALGELVQAGYLERVPLLPYWKILQLPSASAILTKSTADQAALQTFGQCLESLGGQAVYLVPEQTRYYVTSDMKSCQLAATLLTELRNYTLGQQDLGELIEVSWAARKRKGILSRVCSPGYLSVSLLLAEQPDLAELRIARTRWSGVTLEHLLRARRPNKV